MSTRAAQRLGQNQFRTTRGVWEHRAVIELGPFRLWPDERELKRDGVPVAVGARAMDILLYLVSKQGTLVSKRDLMQAVWACRKPSRGLSGAKRS